MNPATGTFTQEDTYQGNIYDAISLHKYLYANANPVVFEDSSGNFALLAECSITTGIRNTISKINEYKYLKIGIKTIQKLNYVIEVINIKDSIQKIVELSNDSQMDPELKIWSIVGEIGQIMMSLTTIVTLVMDTEISFGVSLFSDFVGIFKDSLEVVDAFKNGNSGDLFKAITFMFFDIAFTALDFGDHNLDTKIEKQKQVGKDLLYELTINHTLNGGISSQERRQLMEWAVDFDYLDEMFLIFNRPFKK